MEDEAIGQWRRQSQEIGQRGENDHEVCALEVTGCHVTRVRSPYTPPPCMFEAAVTSQHTEGLGVATQFHFFFFFFSDKWHPDSWKKCWGPWTDFSATKIKCVGVDKDRHFAFYFWTPMRALTNATPPPLRLCHDCFFSLQKCHKLKRWQIYMAQTDTGFFQVYIAYRLTQIEMV